MKRVVIVGAAAAGLSSAEALRRRGFDQEITMIGAEPELPYDRPPLSKQILSGQWTAHQVTLRDQAAIDALALDLRLSTVATGLDLAGQRVGLEDGTDLAYDELIVATGVRPRPLPGAPDLIGVHVLRSLDDALTLKSRLSPGRRLVVVGAGFLGAEVADAATGLGVDVTLLEADTQPMGQAVGEAAGRFLAELHTARGTHLRTGVSVSALVHEHGVVTGVALADGTTIPADDVLIAIGSLPNTGWLEGSGLTLADGLVCDEFSVAAPHVHGVGDVARWYNPLFATSMRIEHRTNASEQGLAVATNLMQPEARRPFAPVPYVWSDQLGLKIQTYGYLRGHDEVHVIECDPAAGRLLIAYRRGQHLTGVIAAGVSPKLVRSWRSLIAAQAPWESAIHTPVSV